MKCPHGSEIGHQAPVVQEQIARSELEGAGTDWLLEFYSACDCCDYLMHKDTPYQVTADGRTLCLTCEESE